MCKTCRKPPASAGAWHNGGVIYYAGIDEAGYGPMLGPLCVATSVFRVDEATPEDGPPDLWSRLEEVVGSRPRDPRRRIAVADSKRLK